MYEKIKQQFRLLRFEKPLINKNSILLTGMMSILMVGVTIYSCMTTTENHRWLIASMILILVGIAVNMLRFRYSALMEIIMTALTPMAMYYLMENFTHSSSQVIETVVILNMILYYLIFGAILFITGRPGITIIAGSFILGLAGLANYFVLLFRSSPILPWDIYSIGVAASVADNFKYELSVRASLVILMIILMWSASFKMRLKFKRPAFRVIGTAAAVVLLIVSGKGMQTDAAIKRFHMNTELFSPTVLYNNNGLALGFTSVLRYLNVEKPETYSEQKLEELQKYTDGSENDTVLSFELGESPNVIVIMNEAFSDLSLLGDFETNMETMPFINSLWEDTQKGWLHVSVKGGNTANSEFEFLTNSTIRFLPVGSVAYQQYIHQYVPSLVGQMNSLGYTTVGMHPYYANGWNREKVYEQLGFDERYFLDDFEGAEVLRDYVTDWETYQKIINRYEQKSSDEKLFVFDVTMQNHGSYVFDYDNFTPEVKLLKSNEGNIEATEQYLSLIRRSDEAFRQLVEYFSNQSEPTIILMFGDHQPGDYITETVDTYKIHGDWGNDPNQPFYVRKENYMVPYIMWANYDITESNGEETSANYLSLKLLNAAGVPMTGYQQYLSDLSQDMPVISMKTIHSMASEDEAALLEDYAILQYNYLFGNKKRLENFYELDINDSK